MSSRCFGDPPPPPRADALARLTELDLLIIGGGIVGAGVARDAALRGLRTGLVEQYDLASGTSGREKFRNSSRIVCMRSTSPRSTAIRSAPRPVASAATSAERPLMLASGFFSS